MIFPVCVCLCVVLSFGCYWLLMTHVAQVSAFLALYCLTLIFNISFYRIVDLSIHVYCSLSFCFPPADAAHPNAWRRFWIKKIFPLVVLFFRKCLNAHAELSFPVVSIVVICRLRLGSTNRASWRNYIPSAPVSNYTAIIWKQVIMTFLTHITLKWTYYMTHRKRPLKPQGR